MPNVSDIITNTDKKVSDSSAILDIQSLMNIRALRNLGSIEVLKTREDKLGHTDMNIWVKIGIISGMLGFLIMLSILVIVGTIILKTPKNAPMDAELTALSRLKWATPKNDPKDVEIANLRKQIHRISAMLSMSNNVARAMLSQPGEIGYHLNQGDISESSSVLNKNRVSNDVEMNSSGTSCDKLSSEK